MWFLLCSVLVYVWVCWIVIRLLDRKWWLSVVLLVLMLNVVMGMMWLLCSIVR